jgi:hypothetical protein
MESRCPPTKELLNPKGKVFHTSCDGEFFMTLSGVRDRKILTKAFNNRNIFIIIENLFDEDTIISKSKLPENDRK